MRALPILQSLGLPFMELPDVNSLGSKPDVCHDLLHPVTLLKEGEFGKDGSDGGFTDPRDRA